MNILVVLLCLALILAEDYYKTLGLPRNATPQQVKKAFRKLSQQYHPDLNKASNAQDMFSKINNAYEVLSDKDKRRRYDQYGEEGLKQGLEQQHDPFEDMFDMFGHSHQGHRRERRGPDLPIKLYVTLEEVYLGKDIELKIIKQTICPHCRGNGADSYDDIHPCQRCNGKGQIIEKQYIGMGMYQQFQTQCPRCNGRGKIIKSTCHVCKGDKVIQGIDTVQVQLERGTPNKHKTTLSGAGDEFHDKAASDIVFTFVTMSHSRFTRRKDDLAVEVQLSLEEALLGFTKTIVHLDGHEVVITRSAVTQPGDVQQLKGEGMPKHQDPSSYGDLFVNYHVQLPTTLSALQQSLLTQMGMQ